eukprot:scaffold3978_cov291-Pinguiococcus_pyrenoidosus.AAC.16
MRWTGARRRPYGLLDLFHIRIMQVRVQETNSGQASFDQPVSLLRQLCRHLHHTPPQLSHLVLHSVSTLPRGHKLRRWKRMARDERATHHNRFEPKCHRVIGMENVVQPHSPRQSVPAMETLRQAPQHDEGTDRRPKAKQMARLKA